MVSNALDEQGLYWLDVPVEFEIGDDGIAKCTIRSGGLTFELRSTIHTAQAGAGSWALAYARHLARAAGQIIRFPGAKGRRG